MQGRKNCVSRCFTLDNAVFFVSLLLLLLYVAVEALHRISPTFSVNAIVRALMLALVCLILYCGGRIRLARLGDSRHMRRLFIIFFIFYIHLILTFTLVDESLGRGGDFIYYDFTSDNLRAHYVKSFVNLTPFRSIYEIYILGLIKGSMNIYYTLLNLLGNVCAFMPLSLFLPLFFKKMRKWYVFLPTIIAIVSLIEALQFIFMIGSCDIDDLILNAGGALALFWIMRIPCIRRLCISLLADCYR